MLGRGSYIHTGLTLTNAGPRNGGFCLNIPNSGGTQRLAYTLPSSKTTVGAAAALNLTSLPDTTTAGRMGIMLGESTTNYGLRAVVNAAGGISLYQNTTLLATSAPALWTPLGYFHLEVKAVSGTGTGTFAARINGAADSQVTATGLTFPAMTHVHLGRVDFASPTTGQFDDFIVWDATGTTNNDWMGDTFVLVSSPVSDGTPNDWAPSTGTAKWATIDETVPSDVDYIIGNTSGDIQECATGGITLPATGAVVAVAAQARALKTDTGASAIALALASGASISSGPSVNLGTGAQVFSHIAEQNPDGSIPWTNSTAQATRFRVQRTA